jgi:hypothetical protein
MRRYAGGVPIIEPAIEIGVMTKFHGWQRATKAKEQALLRPRNQARLDDRRRLR